MLFDSCIEGFVIICIKYRFYSKIKDSFFYFGVCLLYVLFLVGFDYIYVKFFIGSCFCYDLCDKVWKLGIFY